MFTKRYKWTHSPALLEQLSVIRNLTKVPHPQDVCWLPQPPATQASPGFWRRPSAGRRGPLFTVLFICFLLTAALICTQLFMPLGGLPVTEIDNWLVVLLRGTQKTTLHPSPPQIPLQPSATRPKILPFMIQTFGPSVASLKYQSHN